MGWIAHHLILSADLAVLGRRPPAFGGRADKQHRAPIIGGPVFHGLQRGDDLVEVIAVVDLKHVPPPRHPLLGDVVVGIPGLDHAADQGVIDTRVVHRQEHAQPLTNLLGEGYALELLGMTFRQRELPLEGHDLQIRRSPDVVPEHGFAGRRRNPDARRTAIHVVRDVGGFGVTGQGADTANFRVREQGMVAESVRGEQRLQRVGAATESQRVNR